MSLSGIFDPMVRAYFDDNGGGDSSVCNATHSVVFAPHAKEYEVIGGELLYISALTPTYDELTKSLIGMMSVYGDINHIYQTKDFDISVNPDDGLIYIGESVFGLIMIVNPEDAEVEGIALPAGIYVIAETPENFGMFVLIWGFV